nr:uracil nucleotide/cysteinyl leukotriene receptor-like [Danio rerio]|eukprot:XP_021324606.1 uracil nucleotide/cysteinyl leukotriene receptor-like [Danio rerio]
MNNFTVNFTILETSTNSSTQSIGPLDLLEACMYSIGFMFGVPANVYSLWLIITGTSSGVASEFFNFNLLVCETGICLNYLFTVLPFFFSNLAFLPLFLQGLNMAGRGLFQSLICVERYLAVVHPVTFLKYKPLRYRVICCASSWMIILGSCFYSLFIIVSKDDTARVWCLSILSLFFFSIQLFCLVAVLRVLKQSGPGERKRQREENSMKRRAFYLILLTIISMVVSYVALMFTGYSVILAQNNVHVYWVPSTVCFVLSGFVQPVLYLHRARKFSVSSCFCSN